MGEAISQWSNWSGYVTATPQAFAEPQTLDELGELIRNSPGPVRFAGTGHSFTPLVKNDGTILSLDRFIRNQRQHFSLVCLNFRKLRTRQMR